MWIYTLRHVVKCILQPLEATIHAKATRHGWITCVPWTSHHCWRVKMLCYGYHGLPPIGTFALMLCHIRAKSLPNPVLSLCSVSHLQGAGSVFYSVCHPVRGRERILRWTLGAGVFPVPHMQRNKETLHPVEHFLVPRLSDFNPSRRFNKTVLCSFQKKEPQFGNGRIVLKSQLKMYFTMRLIGCCSSLPLPLPLQFFLSLCL